MAKNDGTVNLAVIGAGYWGRKVTSEYMQLSKQDLNFNLAKVCDLKDDNLLFCKENLNVEKEKLSNELDDVLESGEIDAVHICTPNETHFAFAYRALSKGKNVLLEKPMSLSAKEAWSLVKLAESRHLCLQVGHIYRFNNALKKIRELISQDYLGQLFYLKMAWTTLMPSQFNRDIIFDLGPHPVDIMNFLLGTWPTQVSCSARAYRRGTIEEVAYLTMDFDKDIVAHVELSWLQPGKVRELVIIGSNRTATIDCVKQTIRISEDNENAFPIHLEANNTIFDEAQNFISSIRNENNQKNPGHIGAANVAVLESLKKSKAQGKFVDVDLSYA
jgi:UDP-N-acetylglucosamine 3-dehydrogenase